MLSFSHDLICLFACLCDYLSMSKFLLFQLPSREQDQRFPQTSILLWATVCPVSEKPKEDIDLSIPGFRRDEKNEDEKKAEKIKAWFSLNLSRQKSQEHVSYAKEH